MKEHNEYAERVRTQRRTLVLIGLFAAAFIGYLSILWYHQVLEGERYATLAANNMVRTEELPAHRGNILDRRGDILVRNRLSFDVVLQREKLRDKALLVAFLGTTLGSPAALLEARLEAARLRPVHEPLVLEEDVSMAQAMSIEARRLEWPELSIVVAARRSYPEGRQAAHVLGYVGEISEAELHSGRFQEALRGGDIVGKTGIERVYENELQGLKGLKRVVVNSRGRVVEELDVDRAPLHGKDVRLTLDLDLQRELERSLEGHVGAAIFLDPWTGEILAMASAPAFEPNLFARRFPRQEWQALLSDPRKPLQNRATLSRYSPGSTFKLAVAAAALEEGVVTPSTSIFCPGFAIIYGHRFRCHKLGGHGEMNLSSAIVHSCNVYFYNVGKTLGIDRIADYAIRLGLGEKTGLDLVFEDAGLVPTPEWKREARGQPWYAGETISVSIGEGPISVTPVQMVRMAAALANGGRLVTPHLHHKGEAGEDMERQRLQRSAGFSRSTLEALRHAMSEVVNQGTGRKVKLPSVQVAAKTGTAQFSSRSVGVDADDLPYEIRDHAWLIGFAPAADPKIAFVVFIEHGGHGGTTAAPVARNVLSRFFGLDDAAPDVRSLARVQPGWGEAGHAAAP